MCFATENPKGEFHVKVRVAEDKGFWKNDTLKDIDAVYALFKFKNYTDCKRLDVNGGNPDQAKRKMDYVSTLDYNVVSRNCENGVYDVLHDEGSGFGITANKQWGRNNKCYIGWVQSELGPGDWFDKAISATETKKLKYQCWDRDSDCYDSKKPMKCRDKVCQTWPRKNFERCWGSDSDCDGTLGCCPGMFGKQCKKKKKNWWGWGVCPKLK